jgi:hypothetical protein
MRTRLGVTLHVRSSFKRNCHAAQWEPVKVNRSNLRLVVNQSVLMSITCRVSRQDFLLSVWTSTALIVTRTGLHFVSLSALVIRFDIQMYICWFQSCVLHIYKSFHFINTVKYSAFGKSLYTYKGCWKWCPRAYIQAWTRLILFENTSCRSACEMFLMYAVIAVFNSLSVLRYWQPNLRTVV